MKTKILQKIFVSLTAGFATMLAPIAVHANASNGGPDVVQLVGPVVLNTNLRDLPYIPNEAQIKDRRLTIFPFALTGGLTRPATSAFPQVQSLLEQTLLPVPTMPPPLLTFDGIYWAQSGGGGRPPDTNGDVGPNHYVQSVNVSFKVFDKNGNTLAGPTTFNSFFAPLVGTPCSGHNQGDPFVFYDQMADRWVVSDVGAISVPGDSFWECIGVSQTGDPVAGPWNLYALQTDPANPTFLGDFPKMAMWNNPQPGGAYHLTVNVYDSLTATFEAVRIYALDRGSMLNGGPTNAISFMIPFAAMPTPFYSLVPATFRTGNPPPAGRDEFLLAIDTPQFASFIGQERLAQPNLSEGVILTQVHGWYFHVDFANPGNSTFGTGPNHLPNAEITVNEFVDAFVNTSLLVPQPETAQKLNTIGDIVMTPVVYQNRNGTESLWADDTVLLNYPNGPTAIRWYQFDVTGGNFPAMPLQQQDWSNGNDGLWRWLPSIAVDQNGNMAIGYSVSGPNVPDFPSIRYAGRLASDPLNDLGQGEAIMTNGGGAQLWTFGEWGDYSMTTIDPADNISFWHTNEYYTGTAVLNWSTRIGKFQFPAGSPTPTPTATATATPTLTPIPRATPTPRTRPTPAPRP